MENGVIYIYIAMANRNKKYTGCSIIYIIASISHMPLKDIANSLGVTLEALKKRLTLWRREGWNIPHTGIFIEGTVSIRNERGRDVRYVKTETGWKRQPLDVSQYKERKGRPKGAKGKPKITSKVISNMSSPKAPKKEVKVFSTRIHEEKVAFFIPELRMTVYVSPDANASDIREKYIKHRDHERKTIEKTF